MRPSSPCIAPPANRSCAVLDADTLSREAAAILDEVEGAANALHLPGARQEHRSRLERVIKIARRAIRVAGEDGRKGTIASAKSTLAHALAARAEDARHGAGQLSRSAQRAPTVEACDDGWRRVGSIVDTAEPSATEAARWAQELGDSAVSRAADSAKAAAIAARKIVDDRNHAYTFHADPGFSFGEGWYLAAAAVLEGVYIQIEPDKPQTFQVARFVHDAGLGDRLVPPRSRPRANKQLTEIVARGFRPDPAAAQRRLRAAFLGDAAITTAVAQWSDRALADAPPGGKVLVWVRYTTHHPTRNTTHRELVELAQRALAANLVPILVGDALRDGVAPAGAVDMTLFWKEPLFQGEDMRRAQLQFVEHLRRAHGLVGQMGVTTAGMDGPALMGLATMYLTDAPNPRMGEWVGVVPGYTEIVRVDGYLERLSEGLMQWASPTTT